MSCVKSQYRVPLLRYFDPVLWAGVSHLTGLSEQERCERILVVLQAWIDESDDPTHSVFMM